MEEETTMQGRMYVSDVEEGSAPSGKSPSQSSEAEAVGPQTLYDINAKLDEILEALRKEASDGVQ